MPWPCMYLKAHPSSAIQNLTASSVKVFLEMWNRRSPPLMRSTTRYLAWHKHQIVVGGRSLLTEDAHVLYILKAIPQVADKRVINMLEHAALSYDISYAFGPDDCMFSTMSATTPEIDFAGFVCRFAYLHLFGYTSRRTTDWCLFVQRCVLCQRLLGRRLAAVENG